jgi:Uma2 family endonuclease
MSRQPAVAELAPLPFELVYSDGVPLDSSWHVVQMTLFRDLVRQAMAAQGRTDFYAGTNVFVYYSVEQARAVAQAVSQGRPAFRGPDMFWVGGVDHRPERKCWIAWEEGGRLPDVIVELLSPSTARKDRTVKRDLYARVFRTSEYFLCDQDAGTLEGLRLRGGAYQPMTPDAQGRLWIQQLGVSLGLWRGVQEEIEADWIRLFDSAGRLVPTESEAERRRTEAERRRAEAAEAELARLRALLEEPGRG